MPGPLRGSRLDPAQDDCLSRPRRYPSFPRRRRGSPTAAHAADLDHAAGRGFSMRRRFLGVTAKRRRRSLLAGGLAILTVGVVAMSALAVHDEEFQLDGNALSTPARHHPGRWTERDERLRHAAVRLGRRAGQHLQRGHKRQHRRGRSDEHDGLHGRGIQSRLRRAGQPERQLQPDQHDLDDVLHGRQHDVRDRQQGHPGHLRAGSATHDNNVNSKIDIMNAYAASYTTRRQRRQDPVLRPGEEQGQRHQQRRVLVPPG